MLENTEYQEYTDEELLNELVDIDDLFIAEVEIDSQNRVCVHRT